MNIFDDYTHKLLTKLNKNKVQYIVVGRYAVNYYGFRRTTGDADLWLKPENKENKEYLIESFKKFRNRRRSTI